MLNQKIGTFISVLRKEQGLTQEQLAEQLGISNRSVSRWENGRTLPDLSLLQALSAVLDVSLAELLSGQRLPRDKKAEDSVRLALELAQREKDSRRKALNRLFGTGLALMLCAVLFRNLSPAPGIFCLACAGLGIACFLAGFRKNNLKGPAVQACVLAAADGELRMKTAAEMLQFSMKHQTGHIKQHRRAFEALENMLRQDEYAVFAFIGSSCTVDSQPGPWHISAALTNRRLLLAGEQVRGQLLTSLKTEAYDRRDLRALRIDGRKLAFEIGGISLVIEGDQLPSVCEKLRTHLYFP